MLCTRCGEKNEDGVRFCSACGHDLSQGTPSSGEPLPPGLEHSPEAVPAPRAPGDVGTKPPSETGGVAAGGLASGKLVAGRYRIERTLGVGGMGTVYLATDERMQRQVALKFINPPQFWQSRELYLRFLREANVCLDLTHPNIIRIYNLDEWEGQTYLVMEYLHGQTLRERLQQNKQEGKSFDWALISAMMQQLLAAVGHAHAQGVIHRDLKPVNIMMARKKRGGRRLVVMDFGLAKPTEGVEITTSGVAMGTPYYMAPEQYSKGAVDHRADIYSLGVIAYELLTGRLPVGHTPPPPSQLRSDLPKGVDAWVFKALEHNPQNRFQSVQEMHEALRAIGAQPQDLWWTRPVSKGEKAPEPAALQQDKEAEELALRLAADEEEDKRLAEAEEQKRRETEEEARQLEAEGKQRKDFEGSLLLVQQWEQKSEKKSPWTLESPRRPKRDRGTRAGRKVLWALVGCALCGGIGWLIWQALNPTKPVSPSSSPAASVRPTQTAVKPTAKPPKSTLQAGRQAPIYTAWPFDAAEAARRQDETAKTLGVPKETALNLGVPKDSSLGEPVSLRLVLLPAGTLIMGTAPEDLPKLPPEESQPQARSWFDKSVPWEGPPHQVTISRAFYMAATEVTQEQYEVVLGRNPSKLKGATLPVDGVSWNDAAEFCRKLSDKIGRAVRLPTETEWEYACRAGTATAYYSGNDMANLGDYAWFKQGMTGDPQVPRIHPVGQKKPNAFGLYDMHGNVAEWCQDRFGPYEGTAAVDPQGPATGADRVFRGGNAPDPWWGLRSARRIGMAGDSALLGRGFRVVVEVRPGELPSGPAPVKATPVAVAPTTIPTPPPADEAGWVSLFDGKSFDGWQASENPQSFTIRDGMIVAHGAYSHLYYVGPVQGHNFKDFELMVEVMTEPGASGGIAFHAQYQEKGLPATGYDVQINNTPQDPKKTGSLHYVRDIAVSPVKDREWFTCHVTVRGKRIVIKVNDTTTVDYVEPDDWQPPRELKVDRRLSSGTFALEAHDPNSVVYYRNIRVKPLASGLVSDSGWTTLFNGKDLTGWRQIGGTAPRWKVENGVLYCDGKDNDWLSMPREYSDFEMSLEFKLPPAGNSGVFLRHSGQGDGAYNGMEIQLLDDYASQYANMRPEQFCGSVFDVAAAAPGVPKTNKRWPQRASKPANQWQNIVILCVGRRVKVTLNGQVVVDANLDSFPDKVAKHPGLKQTSGYIGLQNYATRCDFRNIRIKELGAK